MDDATCIKVLEGLYFAYFASMFHSVSCFYFVSANSISPTVRRQSNSSKCICLVRAVKIEQGKVLKKEIFGDQSQITDIRGYFGI